MTKTLSNCASIVFDLDGTLIDSEPQVRVSLNRILADFDRRPLTPDEVVPMMGGGAEPMMRMAFEATGTVPDPKEMPEILTRYLGYYLDNPASHTVVFEGVYGVLDICARSDSRWASAPTSPARRRCQCCAPSGCSTISPPW